MAETHTFVGELIGGDQAHCARYPWRGLAFYAVVEKTGERTCVAPEVAFGFFKEQGLLTSRIEAKGVYSSHSELMAAVGRSQS